MNSQLNNHLLLMRSILFCILFAIVPGVLAGSMICDAGTFHPVEESGDNCYACNPGKYTPVAGMPICFDCPPGRYSAGYGHSTCQLCTAGTYQSSGGATTCNVCPDGMTQPSQGSPGCIRCDRGYSAINNTSPCQVCPAGFIQQERIGSCVPCPAGSFSPREGSTSCTTCPHNTYNGAIGQTVCVRCAQGFFTYDRNSSHVDQCLGCEDTIGNTWPRSKWPYTDSYSVVNLFSCLPHLCDSKNAVGRSLCRNFLRKDLTHISDFCSVPINKTDVFSREARQRSEKAMMITLFAPLLFAISIIATFAALKRQRRSSP